MGEEEDDFEQLLQRVRRGESQAACELVRRYESAIRVAVRTRLSDPLLRQQFDSMDVSQSVLASFFVRAAAGQYDLHEPGQLVALLTKMARNKLAMRARSQYQQRRDVRKVSSLSDDRPRGGVATASPPDRSPGPVQQAVHRELLDRAYRLMDPEVRRIADCRAQGTQWDEIATRLGGTAEARRKQFQRAMDAISQTLDLE